MPPSAKFTKEEVIDAALGVVRESGFDALTARALGAALGSSPRPIFTVFQSMENVQQAVVQAARDRYNGYIAKALAPDRAYRQRFKSVGAQYIRFATEEPKLFQLLFMRTQEAVPAFSQVLGLIEENYSAILASIQEEYGLRPEEAKGLYRHLWIYSHGIASLCATKMCRFTEGEIGAMMTEVCVSLLRSGKGGEKHD